MIGAIAGDIIGSIYERCPIKTKDFPLFNPNCCFTDDSVLTLAVANAILNNGDYFNSLRDIGRRYPNAGYGGSFIHWLFSESPKPYNSWGNGSAMRVSPVGFAFDNRQDVLTESKKCSEITHNHPEGIKGAQATALAIFLARTTGDKEEIKNTIQSMFGYNLSQPLNRIRTNYCFDISCQGTVPQAIIAFLESTSYEDAVRNAISLGGDSDTIACITGGIADAYYGGVTSNIVDNVLQLLTEDLIIILKDFCEKFNIPVGTDKNSK